VIDLDANLIGFNYIDAAAKGSAQAVMECAQAGVDNGIEMVIIADGDSRHSSKRSSASRAVGREKNRMNAMEMDMKLSKSLQENADQILIGELSKALEKERNKARWALPHDFANVLKSEVARHSHALLKAARLDVHFSPEAKMVNNKTSVSATKQTPPPAVQSKKIRPRYIISSLVPSEGSENGE